MKYKDLFKMYMYYFQKYREKGLLDNLDIKLGGSEMKESYDKIITNKYIVKLYHVVEVPRVMSRPLNLLLLSARGSHMLMDFYTYSCREVIDWTSPYMKKVKASWEQHLKENPSRLDANKLNTSEDFESASKSKAASTSWNLISQKTSEGSVTVKTETVVIVRYVKPISMKTILQEETQMIKDCQTFGIILSPITKDIKEIYKTMSPTTIPDYQPVNAYMTVLDENISQFETYSSGKVDGDKVFMGMDIITKILVFIDLLNTGGGALNVMLAASTGSGKSFYIKIIITLLAGTGINVVIWDRDGEYEEQCSKLNAMTLNLGATGGKYFNSVPIDLDDKDGYQNSIQETLTYFDLLCDLESGMTSNEKYIFNLAYTDMFKTHGVIQDDKESWVKSKTLGFNTIYNHLQLIKGDIDEDLTLEYTNMMRKLYLYFAKDGLKKGLFDEELDITDILSMKKGDQPLILCINMQTKTKNEEASNNIVDRMKSLTMSYVTDRIIANNKRLGEETLLVVEEVQRHLHNHRFITDVHDNVTGGRKKNVILFLITNAINNMINSDNQMVRDIVDNMDTMIIGGLKENARELIAKAHGLENCLKELEKIYEMSLTDSSYNNIWKNSFLVKTKKEVTIVKMFAPKELRESTILKTRDDSKAGTDI